MKRNAVKGKGIYTIITFTVAIFVIVIFIVLLEYSKTSNNNKDISNEIESVGSEIETNCTDYGENESTIVVTHTASDEENSINRTLSSSEYKSELDNMIASEVDNYTNSNNTNKDIDDIKTISYMNLQKMLYGDIYKEMDCINKTVVIDGEQKEAYGEYRIINLTENKEESVSNYSNLDNNTDAGKEYFSKSKNGYSNLIKASNGNIHNESECTPYASYVGTYVVYEEGTAGVKNKAYTVSIVYYFITAK